MPKTSCRDEWCHNSYRWKGGHVNPWRFSTDAVCELQPRWQQQGDWGTLHARRVTEWAAHLGRPRNHESLASMFFRWHGADWLEGRRRDPDVGGPSRPGTRIASGFLCARWDESVKKAKLALAR